MAVKTKKKSWSGRKTFGIWGLISGTVTLTASKEILDTVRPGAQDNLPLAMSVGVTTGFVIGVLTGSGVLCYAPIRKKVIKK